MMGSLRFRSFYSRNRSWANLTRSNKNVFELMFEVPKGQSFALQSDIEMSHLVFETTKLGNLKKMLYSVKKPNKILFKISNTTSLPMFISVFVVNPWLNLLKMEDFRKSNPRNVVLKAGYFKGNDPEALADFGNPTNEHFDLPSTHLPAGDANQGESTQSGEDKDGNLDDTWNNLPNMPEPPKNEPDIPEFPIGHYFPKDERFEGIFLK